MSNPVKPLNVLLTFVLMKCRFAPREQLRKPCFLLSLSVTPTPQFPPSANTVIMATSLPSLLVFLLSAGQVEGIPILVTGRRGGMSSYKDRKFALYISNMFMGFKVFFS